MKMKAFLFAFVLLVTISSCHRKTTPATSDTDNNSNTESKKPSPVTTYGKALIVVDSKGDLFASKESLLANGAKSGFPATSARAFTPQERANLIARFKTVPPRILHVPDRLTKKTAQGQYYVLREKFWYWKKNDG